MSAPIIGIDLGTTNSVVAVVRNDRPEIIPMADGSTFLPSAVRFFPDGSYVVGHAARRGAAVDPRYTVTSIKRFIGRMYNEVADLAEMARFTVVPREDGRAAVQLYDRAWLPEEICALVLAQLKEAAERHLGEAVSRAVMTIPAYFTAAQGQATRRAADLANLKVERFVTEPTAAAMAHGPVDDTMALVLDLGGGTYDVSVLGLDSGVFRVHAVDGDGYLGGDDFDDALLSWAAAEIRRRHGRDVEESPEAVQRLRDAVIEAKCTLSSTEGADISLPFLFHDARGRVDVDMPISRMMFESLSEQLFERLIPPIKRVLGNAGVDPKELDAIFAIGAATRMPRFASAVADWTGKRPSYRIDPDHAVALGAATQGGVLHGDMREIVLVDSTPYGISIETAERAAVMLIDVNTSIPTEKSEIFTTAHDNQTSVEITVLEGTAADADTNRFLTRFILADIPPAPAGIPQVQVTADIGADGALRVDAKDLSSGRKASAEKIHLR